MAPLCPWVVTGKLEEVTGRKTWKARGRNNITDQRSR